MKWSRRTLVCSAAAALAASCLPAAALAGTTKSIAYPGIGSSAAYLIDWQPKKRARVVNYDGAGVGGVSNDGTRDIVTLDAPIVSLVSVAYDACDNEIQQRKDLNQVTVRNLDGGVSNIAEIGTYTNIGGCQDGLVTPFGSLGDEGSAQKRVSMAARPPVTDLVPGTQVAGFGEDLATPDNPFYAVDVVTLQAGGTALFQTTGHVVPAAFDANDWLVFSLPTQQRAYARLSLDKTGGETWLVADWVGGQPQNVQKAFVVKPLAGAGFGTKAEASRMWESGLFIGSRKPFYLYLYKNGTGERVSKDLDLGTETRSPIAAWGFDGANLTLTREFGGPDYRAERTWVPLHNDGRVRWVMESEVYVIEGEVSVAIKPRVNYYLDTGKAVPPANGVARSAGMVYLGEKPKLPR